MIRRRTLAAIAASASVAPATFAPAAFAQDWPTRPIRLVVAFAPGGATDVLARLTAEHLSRELGQPVVVDNRAGAAGIIGTEHVARAAPDGHTLLLGTASTHAMNVPLYGARLSYDPTKDFAPVARVANGYNVLVVNPSVPARSVAELIALAKARPGSLAYGSGGNGTSSHLGAEMFKSMAGVDILHVPFRSTAPAATALMTGDVQVMFDTSVSSLPLVRDGKLRLLAVASPARLADMPDVPAVAEGLPGFEMGTWNGLYAPAGTPPAIIARLNRAVAVVVGNPELIARYATLGTVPFYAGPEAFDGFQTAEIARWTEVVRTARITMD